MIVSARGRNSDDAVFEDLERCGRWPAVYGRSRGTSNDIGRGSSGEKSCGGLFGGRVAGLSGIWKYLVVRGSSIVETDAMDLVRVGGW